MNRKIVTAMACLALGMGGTAPASAQSATEAEQIRRLDIMLMVTSLRCRMGEDNFTVDFQAFEHHHLAELNNAALQLKRNLGPQADRALDRISTSIANQYGTGHPWLSCHDLKELTHQLAQAQGSAVLLDAARQVFSGDVQLAHR